LKEKGASIAKTPLSTARCPANEEIERNENEAGFFKAKNRSSEKMAIKKIECAGLIGWVSPNAEGRWSMSRKITRTGGNRRREKSNFLFAIIAMPEMSIDIAKRANS
jgi:hypothetical protein